MEVIGAAQLAGGVTDPCLVDLTLPATAQDLALAARAAQEVQVPVIGTHPGALPAGFEELAEALTLTLVEQETVASTVALAGAREAVEAGVLHSPRAAAAVVGLLRVTSALAVRDGLVAESFA
jgi:hypothetical protein